MSTVSRANAAVGVPSSFTSLFGQRSELVLAGGLFSLIGILLVPLPGHTTAAPLKPISVPLSNS